MRVVSSLLCAAWFAFVAVPETAHAQGIGATYGGPAGIAPRYPGRVPRPAPIYGAPRLPPKVLFDHRRLGGDRRFLNEPGAARAIARRNAFLASRPGYNPYRDFRGGYPYGYYGYPFTYLDDGYGRGRDVIVNEQPEIEPPPAVPTVSGIRAAPVGQPVVYVIEPTRTQRRGSRVSPEVVRPQSDIADPVSAAQESVTPGPRIVQVPAPVGRR